MANVPWARSGSKFTLLFESYVMMLAPDMPVQKIGELVDEHDTMLWRIIHHHVDDARSRADYSAVNKIGVDETSSKRGHEYVSVFVDLDQSRVIYATDGKDHKTVEAFKTDFCEHHGSPEKVTDVSCDMSPAFIKGVTENLPNASITFDKFHVVKILNEAVDEVRRQEAKETSELKNTRYIFLKNPENLTKSQSEKLEKLKLKNQNLKTMRAYQIRLNFQDFWNQPPEEAEGYLKRWYYWATHSRLEPIQEAARTIKRHWNGILRWFKSHINNGILEGINSMIQAAKARARGYRNTKYLKAMIYLLNGKLEFRFPT
jgi:transposase